MKNLIWGIVNFDVTWFIAVLVVTVFLWNGKYIIASRILYAFVLVGIVIIVTPFPEWGMTYIENRFLPKNDLPKNIKGVIIIGGIVERDISRSRGQPCYNLFGARMAPILKLMDQRPDLIYIIMGGGVPYKPGNQEADILERELAYLKSKVPHILFDNKSNNTVESARSSLKILNPKADEKWLLLTSAYHMPRAVGVFKKAGWNIIPFPVDYRTSGKYRVHMNFSLWWGFMLWSISSYEFLMNILSYLNGESYSMLPSDRDFANEST